MNITATPVDERITRYIAWPPLSLPVHHSDGYTLCEFKGMCKGCGEPCKDLRGEVIEWPNCLQLRCAGRCEQCSLVTVFEIRWAKDSMVHHSSEGWVIYPFNISIWRRMWNWIKQQMKG
jgi:hypothetical protein